MTLDRNYLLWLHGRLINKYGEDENVDFVQKLHCIALNTDPKANTPVFPIPVLDSPEKYHVLGQTSTRGAKWFIWEKDTGNSVLRDIYDFKTAQVFAKALNEGSIVPEDIAGLRFSNV
jgi:hypothetical protein